MLEAFFIFLSSFGLLGTAFWVWMLYDCLKNGSGDRYLWLWALILLNIIGAFLYFFICWMPRYGSTIPVPRFLSRRRLRDALWQAEAEARNIGKAHQYIKLGDILFELDQLDKSANAYNKALELEPDHPKALWGAAWAERNNKNLEAAKTHLQRLLKVEAGFSYGNASLTYGELLFDLGNLEAAKTHLKLHLKSWSHPDAYMTLARIYQQQGDIATARETLETMIYKIKSFVPFQYRKNQHFISQAEKTLKKLK
ncbi:tetratricopeptide repeat protein [Pseudanabaena sp. 'Roaring Creek']|uniref:tetratricopeptide repeat protein n=1 Tax=Pseudanabaena sp. 'Roaring Creek' TaxID=1681830 RepID=UPI0006D7EE38|nr:PLD nuclease N-terminal domain-containing protein [Pseudanabaena sp. 'Roaring Creek']